MAHKKKPASQKMEPCPLTPLDQEFLRSAEQVRTVTINGQTVELSQEAIAVSTLYKNALGGSVHGMGQWLLHTKHAQEKREAERARKVELGQLWYKQQTALLDAAVSKGENTRLILPHPDDIVLDPIKGFKIIGPFDEESLVKVERGIKERNVFMLQAALEDRLEWPSVTQDGSILPANLQGGSALFLAEFIDQSLPERFRLSDQDKLSHISKQQGKTKRELLRELRKAWRSIGIDVPRGTRTLPLYLTINAMEAIKPLLPDMLTAEQVGSIHESDYIYRHTALTMLKAVGEEV